MKTDHKRQNNLVQEVLWYKVMNFELSCLCRIVDDCIVSLCSVNEIVRWVVLGGLHCDGINVFQAELGVSIAILTAIYFSIIG